MTRPGRAVRSAPARPKRKRVAARRAFAALVALVLLGCVTGAAVLHSQGVRLYVVQSGSMIPTLKPADLVVVRPERVYSVGDIVTFGGLGRVTTHRVADLGPQGLVTKGDANTSTDAVPVPLSAVDGRVERVVPLIGYAVVFFKQPTGAGGLLTGLLTLALLWGMFFPAADGEQVPAAAPGSPRRHRRAQRRDHLTAGGPAQA